MTSEELEKYAIDLDRAAQFKLNADGSVLLTGGTGGCKFKCVEVSDRERLADALRGAAKTLRAQSEMLEKK